MFLWREALPFDLSKSLRFHPAAFSLCLWVEFWWLCFNRLYLLKVVIALCLLSSAGIAARWTFPGPQMVGAFYNTDCILPEGEKYMRSLLISLKGCVFLVLVSLFRVCWSHFCFVVSIAPNWALKLVPFSLSKATVCHPTEVLRFLYCWILRADCRSAVGNQRKTLHWKGAASLGKLWCCYEVDCLRQDPNSGLI